MNSSTRGVAPLVILGYLALATVGMIVLTPAPAGGKAAWYSWRSWGKHKPADQFDAAKTKEQGAAIALTDSAAQLVHSANVELDKANRAVPSLPPSPATEVVKRTVANAAGALNQVSPLSAAESQANIALLTGLLSTEVAARAAAEARQVEVEKDLIVRSKDLERLRAEHDATVDALAQTSAKLRGAFEERNALANELESGKVRSIITWVVIAVLLGLVVYAKIALGGVGRALHLADDNAFAQVASGINTELGALGQWMIRSGRQGAAVAEAKKDAAERSAQPAVVATVQGG